MTALSAVIAALLLASCPNPIPIQLAAQISDTEGPVITITEPADRSEYSTVVRVSGTVGDRSGDRPVQISNCTYELRGTTVSGSFDVDEAGVFSFMFPTQDADGTRLVGGTVTLELTACDWSGNHSAQSIELVPSLTGDVPGFTVTPGNKQVTIEWIEVPGAESYAIIEHKFGLKREGVQTRYVWADLENGIAYRFQIVASVADGVGHDAASSTLDTMPLSSRTFAPSIREVGLGSITIDWYDSQSVEEYVVERALAPDGPWEVRRNLQECQFTDNRVEHDTTYWYRVRPAAFPEISSAASCATPARFGYEIVGRSFGGGSDADVNGAYAYVAGDGLQVVDISEPEHPSIVASRATTGSPTGVCVAGSHAYLSIESNGLAVIDVSDPLKPGTPVYRSTTGCAYDVAVVDDFAYVAAGGAGLAIIDVTNPSNPGDPIYCDTDGVAEGVAVFGSYAFVAERDTSSLTIIDVQEPTNPGTPVSCPITGGGYDVTVMGSYAYVAMGESGIAVVNVADPEHPSTPVYYDIGGSAQRVVADSNCLYVADRWGAVHVIRITEPETPTTLAQLPMIVEAQGIALFGSYAFAVGAIEYVIINVANVMSPADPVIGSTGDIIYGVAVAGQNAFTASEISGLAIIDVSNPSVPGEPAYCSLGDQTAATSASISNTHAYVSYATTGWLGGIAIVEVSDPSSPKKLSNLDLGFMSWAIAVSGQYAYTTHQVSLSVTDISDPVCPIQVGSCEILGEFRAKVAVRLGYAYVACGDEGLAIIDVTDPENPLPLSYAGSSADDVAVAGSYAYVAGGGGLGVIDIQDPENPGSATYYPTPAAPQGITVAGTHAYIATAEGLTVFDIANPAAPVIVVNTPCPSAEDVVVAGSVAYVARSNGLAVIELWQER